MAEYNHRCCRCGQVLTAFDGAFIPEETKLICRKDKFLENQLADEQTVNEAALQRLEHRLRQTGHDETP